MTADPIPTLRDYRLSLGMSQDEVADHLQVDVERVAALETGTSRPTADERGALADLFMVDGREIDRALGATRLARKPRKRKDDGLDIIDMEGLGGIGA